MPLLQQSVEHPLQNPRSYMEVWHSSLPWAISRIVFCLDSADRLNVSLGEGNSEKTQANLEEGTGSAGEEGEGGGVKMCLR